MISPVFLIAPFWEAFFLIVIFVPLVMLWLFALMDLFVRRDLSGWAKALWLFAILLLPLLGILIYYLVRPRYDVEVFMPPPAASGPGVADQLEKLTQLRDAGAISDDEFARLKGKLIT